MIDREKVIKGLHCCAKTDGISCVYCPYDNMDEDCTALLSMDVLDLLKEQEAKPVKIVRSANGYVYCRCPKCNRIFYEEYERPKHCDICGQAVMWDD